MNNRPRNGVQPMNASERQLLSAAQRGDMTAFAALFEPMRPALVRVAGGLVGDSEAEDVVMDAMLKAWRALPSFRKDAALRTWTIRVVRNAALDALRARSRRREVPLDAPPDEEESGAIPVASLPDPSTRHPGEDLAAADRRAAAAAALAKLDPHHRQVLELRFLEELSYQEIATATGVSIGTVISRLFYAKRKLARLAVLDPAAEGCGVPPSG